VGANPWCHSIISRSGDELGIIALLRPPRPDSRPVLVVRSRRAPRRSTRLPRHHRPPNRQTLISLTTDSSCKPRPLPSPQGERPPDIVPDAPEPVPNCPSLTRAVPAQRSHQDRSDPPGTIATATSGSVHPSGVVRLLVTFSIAATADARAIANHGAGQQRCRPQPIRRRATAYRRTGETRRPTHERPPPRLTTAPRGRQTATPATTIPTRSPFRLPPTRRAALFLRGRTFATTTPGNDGRVSGRECGHRCFRRPRKWTAAVVRRGGEGPGPSPAEWGCVGGGMNRTVAAQPFVAMPAA